MTSKEIFLEEMGRLFDVMWEYFDEDGLDVLEVFDAVQKKLNQNQMACDPSLTPEENSFYRGEVSLHIRGKQH